MPPEQLYLLQNGEQTGPFPTAAIRGMIESGTISPQDFVWAEGMPEWAAAGPLLGVSGPAPAAVASAPAASADFVLPAERSFGGYVLDALSYPFRGDGLLILILGSVLFVILGFVGSFSFLISAASWGYLMLMLQQVIHGTAMGEDSVPNWPDFDGFGELLVKAFQWFVVLAFCYAAFVILLMQAEKKDDDTYFGLALLAFAAGSIYFPMAILSVAMHDSVGGLNPLAVVRGILKTPGHYLLTLVVFAILVVVQGLAGSLTDFAARSLSGGSRIAGIVVFSFIDKLDELWSAIFLARILGGLYRVNRFKLSWFGEGD